MRYKALIITVAIIASVILGLYVWAQLQDVFRANEPIWAYGESGDKDDDQLTFTIVWTINGVEAQRVDDFVGIPVADKLRCDTCGKAQSGETYQEGDPCPEAECSGTLYVMHTHFWKDQLAANLTNKGDVVAVRVRAYDGEEYSNWGTAELTVAGWFPVLDIIRFSKEEPMP